MKTLTNNQIDLYDYAFDIQEMNDRVDYSRYPNAEEVRKADNLFLQKIIDAAKRNGRIWP